LNYQATGQIQQNHHRPNAYAEENSAGEQVALRSLWACLPAYLPHLGIIVQPSRNTACTVPGAPMWNPSGTKMFRVTQSGPTLSRTASTQRDVRLYEHERHGVPIPTRRTKGCTRGAGRTGIVANGSAGRTFHGYLQLIAEARLSATRPNRVATPSRSTLFSDK